MLFDLYAPLDIFESRKSQYKATYKGIIVTSMCVLRDSLKLKNTIEYHCLTACRKTNNIIQDCDKPLGINS